MPSSPPIRGAISRRSEQALSAPSIARPAWTCLGGDCYVTACSPWAVDAVVESGAEARGHPGACPSSSRGAGGVITTWTGGDPQDGGFVASGDERLYAVAEELGWPGAVRSVEERTAAFQEHPPHLVALLHHSARRVGEADEEAFRHAPGSASGP